jgi:aerobic-type carbon monoxide dehydrogenase small subunit (CoxS/CutS family)
MKTISLNVNGKKYDLAVKPNDTLLDVIRGQIGLTGTKEGCGLGECGACTVVMDGRTVASCLILAEEAHGKNITTIEGLAQGEKLHPVQQAFVDMNGLECGFCSPGMIMSAKALLEENPHPTEDDIKRGLAGNICRCTGYAKIFEAVKTAADRMEEDKGR